MVNGNGTTSKIPPLQSIIAAIGVSTLLVLTGWSIIAGANAAAAAHEVKAALTVHEARQNGTLETIDTRLTSICTYHSKFRTDMKDMRQEHREDTDEFRKEIRDLIIKSLSHPGPTQ